MAKNKQMKSPNSGGGGFNKSGGGGFNKSGGGGFNKSGGGGGGKFGNKSKFSPNSEGKKFGGGNKFSGNKFGNKPRFGQDSDGGKKFGGNKFGGNKPKFVANTETDMNNGGNKFGNKQKFVPNSEGKKNSGSNVSTPKFEKSTPKFESDSAKKNSAGKLAKLFDPESDKKNGGKLSQLKFESDSDLSDEEFDDEELSDEEVEVSDVSDEGDVEADSSDNDEEEEDEEEEEKGPALVKKAVASATPQKVQGQKEAQTPKSLKRKAEETPSTEKVATLKQPRLEAQDSPKKSQPIPLKVVEKKNAKKEDVESDSDDEDDEEDDEDEEEEEASDEEEEDEEEEEEVKKEQTPAKKGLGQQQPKEIVKTPSLTPQPQKQQKEVPTPISKAQKRKAEESPAATKQPRLDGQEAIVKEEQRRREERDKKSLFIKALGRELSIQDIKSLHPDVVSVRTVGSHAWLIFPSEHICTKAYKALSDKKVGGVPLVIDFCGDKSKKNSEEGRKNARDYKGARPVNPLEIVVSGLPKSVNMEQLQKVFPSAKEIKIPTLSKHQKHNTVGFIRFEDEAEAKKAFVKGESLKINGEPVDVFYARLQTGKVQAAKRLPQTQKSQQKQQEESEEEESSDDDDDEE